MHAPPIQWLLDAATRRPSEVAVRFTDAAWTWARLADEVLRTAAVVANQGFEPDSRIGLVMGAGAAYVTGLLGVIAAGCTAVPLSPLYTPREYAVHIRLNALAGIVTDPANARDCSIALRECGATQRLLSIGRSDFAADIAAMIAGAVPYVSRILPNRTAVVFHTSGATGGAKLVPRTHGQLAAECDSVASSLRTSSDDSIFCMLPLHKSHGMLNCLFAALRAQCSLFIYQAPRGSNVEDVAAELARARSTIFPSIPYQLERLLAARRRHDLSYVRWCFTGGASLRPSIFAAFRRRFGVEVRQQYRCTEAGALTLNLDDEAAASSETVGTSLAGVSVAVRGADASGEGEIFVRSKSLAAGYEGMPDLNRAVFVDGGFLTGDLGSIDSAGNLRVTRRRPIYVDAQVTGST